MYAEKEASYNFFLVTTLILGIVTIFPIIQSSPFHNIIWAALVPIWFISALLYHPSFINKNLITYISFGLFLSALIALCIGTNYFFLANRYLEYALLYVFLASAEIIVRTKDRKHRIKLFYIVLTFFLLTSLQSLPAYIYGGSFIARTAELGTVEGRAILSQGIGGYNFIYAILLLVAPLLLLIRENLSTLFKGLSILAILLFILCILFSGFFTASALLIVAIVLFLVLGSLTKDVLSLGLFILFLITPFLILAGYFFVQLFAEGSSTNLLIARLNEFYILLNSGYVELSIGSRLDRLQITMDIAQSYPLAGLIFSGKTTLAGEHSFILDAFAYFGVLGGLLNFLFFVLMPFGIINKNSPIRTSAAKSITMILFVGLLFLNNLTSSIAFVAFFLIMITDSYENEEIN